MSWTHDDPGAGDLHGLRAATRLLDNAARSLSDVHFDVRSHTGTLTHDAWEGQAGDAWREAGETCLTNLGGLVEEVIAASGALSTYADLVEQIAEEAVAARRQREIARAQQALLLLAPPPMMLPGGKQSTAAELRRRARERQQARDDAQVAVNAADAALNELVERRAAADTQVNAAVGTVEIEDWRDIGRASAIAGLTRPDMINGSGVKDVLNSLALDVLDGNASMDDLVRMLQAWEGDADVMSDFFRALGGSRTVDLIDVLSTQVYEGTISADVARAQSEALLSAMSLASAGWTPAQARLFTEQLTEHPQWPGAIGFLFSSAATAPMGEAFTVAIADHIDTSERANGSWLSWEPADGHVLAHVLFPDRAGRGTDPMSGVLETLGRYPEAALGWLLKDAGGNSVPRIDYWVGERSWESDGFLGVSALWSGLQSVPGGPLDAGRYDQRVWSDVARVSTAFGRGLFANPAALPENFSAEAQVHLATALGQMMALLAYNIEVDPAGKKLVDDVEIRVSSGDGLALLEKRPILQLSQEQIARLFGLASTSSAGRVVLGTAVRNSQEQLLFAALTTPGFYPDAALRQVANIQALFDGALTGSVAGITGRAAERVGQLVDAACSLIALVPVPGSGKVAGWLTEQGRELLGEKFASWAAGKAVGQVTSAARSSAADALTAWLAEDAAARAALDTWQGDEVVFESGTRESLTAFLESWIAVFQDIGGRDAELARLAQETSEKLTNTYDALRKLAEGEASK